MPLAQRKPPVVPQVQYNYTTFADPSLASGWLTLSGASYRDGSQAQYVYQRIYAGQHPLLLSADDPRIAMRRTCDGSIERRS